MATIAKQLAAQLIGVSLTPTFRWVLPVPPGTEPFPTVSLDAGAAKGSANSGTRKTAEAVVCLPIVPDTHLKVGVNEKAAPRASGITLPL